MNKKKTPPSLPDVARLGLKAPTADEQWQQVEEWHQFLSTNEVENYPALQGLKSTWELISSDDEGLIERGLECKSVSSAPLAAMFYFINSGFYPPPELLLSLSETWDCYLNAKGKVSLETAFLGSGKPKAGNYAAQKYALIRNGLMALEMGRHLKKGMPRIKAAEKVAASFRENYGIELEPDSIVRTIKPFGSVNQKAKKVKQEK